MPSETTAFSGELHYQAEMGAWRGPGELRILPSSQTLTWSIRSRGLRKGLTGTTHYLQIVGVECDGSKVQLRIESRGTTEFLSMKSPNAKGVAETILQWCRLHHGTDEASRAAAQEEEARRRSDPMAAPLTDAEVRALEIGMGTLRGWWPDPAHPEEASEEPFSSECALASQNAIMDEECHPSWPVYWFSDERLDGDAFCARCLRAYLEQGIWPWSDPA